MSTKTISISEEAYNALKSVKDERESFTDAILKVAKKDTLSKLAGILSKKEGKELRANIAESRKRSRERMGRVVRRFQ